MVAEDMDDKVKQTATCREKMAKLSREKEELLHVVKKIKDDNENKSDELRKALKEMDKLEKEWVRLTQVENYAKYYIYLMSDLFEGLRQTELELGFADLWKKHIKRLHSENEELKTQLEQCQQQLKNQLEQCQQKRWVQRMWTSRGKPKKNRFRY